MATKAIGAGKYPRGPSRTDPYHKVTTMLSRTILSEEWGGPYSRGFLDSTGCSRNSRQRALRESKLGRRAVPGVSMRAYSQELGYEYED